MSVGTLPEDPALPKLTRDAGTADDRRARHTSLTLQRTRASTRIVN